MHYNAIDTQFVKIFFCWALHFTAMCILSKYLLRNDSNGLDPCLRKEDRKAIHTLFREEHPIHQKKH